MPITIPMLVAGIYSICAFVLFFYAVGELEDEFDSTRWAIWPALVIAVLWPVALLVTVLLGPYCNWHDKRKKRGV